MDSCLSNRLKFRCDLVISNPVTLIMFSLRLHPTQPLALLGSTAPRSKIGNWLLEVLARSFDSRAFLWGVSPSLIKGRCFTYQLANF